MKTTPMFLALIAMTGLSACARDPASYAGADADTAPAAAAADESTATVDATLPPVVVYMQATCGCCELWVRHMRRFGFQVETHDVQDLGAAKADADIPYGLGSCHTARVGKYFIEGHVPAEDVKRLLFEKPDARGLTVPGMPVGSPGMEQGNLREPYDVLLVATDGSTAVYAHHGD